MIESVCPTCGNKKVFEDDKLGKKYKCPSCSNTVVIEKVNATATMQDEVLLDVQDIRQKMNPLQKLMHNASDNTIGKIYVGGFIIWFCIWGGLKESGHWEYSDTFNHIFSPIWFIGGLAFLIYNHVKSK